jgi:uncharacterized glyoxalase superfamily metalloenzyme YdcJ
MSTLDWLLENEYPLLLLLFVQGMVPYGYGDVRQVPVVSFFFRDIPSVTDWSFNIFWNG